jgi:hypothetical protein
MLLLDLHNIILIANNLFNTSQIDTVVDYKAWMDNVVQETLL